MIRIALAQMATAVALSAQAFDGFNAAIRSLPSEAAPATSRNGGKQRTVAQAQRRAAKSRRIRRAKRLGHY
ncbi:hypothetical protein RSO41_12350 [Halomonas sp. I1]|uniref:hypothetical protein n=1 Tax=Halomonas sp. I1 TaxID=393536 RepID=UPI0028DFBA85|nr:hypothetical protein [Halomonas sp. I1]MDT8895447.1 hypothetical protein [Halomonas sp. I1]